MTLICCVLFTVNAATAHTANISSSRIVIGSDSKYRVDVGFLVTDIEQMLDENKAALAGVDLTEPGLLESLVGKFVQSRIDLQNEEGIACVSAIVTVGEDSENPDDSRAVLQFDCSGVPGRIFYNPFRLLEAQGVHARQLVSIERNTDNHLTDAQSPGKEPVPGQVMIYPGDRPIDLSEPLLGSWELAPKFFYAGVEHIITGYDHLCFLVATILWATRIWPVVKIVTAFTVSHSLTLTLAALHWTNLPGKWVEIAIAASIIYVALENFFSRSVEGKWKDTFAFGFIHGFGFASGLMEMGVPQRAIVPVLASFNIGVEAGQVGVVLIVTPLLLMFDRYFTKGRRSGIIVYALSGLIALSGVYWLLVRFELVSG